MFVCVFDCFALTSAFTVAVSFFLFLFFRVVIFSLLLLLLLYQNYLLHYFVVFSFGNFGGMLCTTKKSNYKSICTYIYTGINVCTMIVKYECLQI